MQNELEEYGEKGVKVKNINVLKHVPQIMLLFIPQIANQVYKILDTTMIGKIIEDKSETGYYDQAQKVIRLLLTLVTSLGVVMIPRMASTYASGDKEKIRSYLKMSFKFVFFMAFPIMFGIISISESFVPIFFGKGYDKVIILINIISPILILMGVGNVLGTQYLLPTKQQKEYTISVTIGVIVNFILNYFLIHMYQSIGASIATVLSELVVVSVQYHYIKNEINFNQLVGLGWKYLTSGLVMFFICYIVRIVLSMNYFDSIVSNLATNAGRNQIQIFNIVLVISQMIVGIITYFGMLVILKDDYIFKFFDKIKNILFKKKVEEE